MARPSFDVSSLTTCHAPIWPLPVRANSKSAGGDPAAIAAVFTLMDCPHAAEGAQPRHSATTAVRTANEALKQHGEEKGLGPSMRNPSTTRALRKLGRRLV